MTRFLAYASFEPASSPPRLPVSLIIPCASDPLALEALLGAVSRGSCWPSEVLVVDAAQRLQGYALLDGAFSSLVRIIDSPALLFPGAARNLACELASLNWLAFLDINTFPSPEWLESTYDISQRQPLIEMVLGSTRYVGESWQQRLFITATYGERPLPTLPGSMVHRVVFSRMGGFLPGVRAGEDTDWMVRARQFGISQTYSFATPVIYSAVPSSLWDLVHKWFRNYTSCAPVVFHLEAHKTVYILAANLLIIFIAFNWNALAADWRQSSPLYIPNITKILFACIVVGYLLVRGLAMPFRRGSALNILLPARWLFIGLVCTLLDFTKLVAFLMSRRPR